MTIKNILLKKKENFLFLPNKKKFKKKNLKEKLYFYFLKMNLLWYVFINDLQMPHTYMVFMNTKHGKIIFVHWVK